jgi:hypothetical protein
VVRPGLDVSIDAFVALLPSDPRIGRPLPWRANTGGGQRKTLSTAAVGALASGIGAGPPNGLVRLLRRWGFLFVLRSRRRGLLRVVGVGDSTR